MTDLFDTGPVSWYFLQTLQIVVFFTFSCCMILRSDKLAVFNATIWFLISVANLAMVINKETMKLEYGKIIVSICIEEKLTCFYLIAAKTFSRHFSSRQSDMWRRYKLVSKQRLSSANLGKAPRKLLITNCISTLCQICFNVLFNLAYTTLIEIKSAYI